MLKEIVFEGMNYLIKLIVKFYYFLSWLVVMVIWLFLINGRKGRFFGGIIGRVCFVDERWEIMGRMFFFFVAGGVLVWWLISFKGNIFDLLGMIDE